MTEQPEVMNAVSWKTTLSEEKNQPYFTDTMNYVKEQRMRGVKVYPPAEDVFNALKMTALEDVRVVILGQDPYHGPNQAHGLCFSVKPGIAAPPSLVNIYKELSNDIEGFNIPGHGYLKSWAEQGVLMLNTVLTVEAGKAHSHKHLGWETFTDKVISVVNEYRSNVVFMLWGAHAQKKGSGINRQKHLVLHAPHPSPLSAHRGFLGCRHFSKTNEYLTKHGLGKIDWHLPEIGR